MAIITFMSDYGYSDHYVAAVKARILRRNRQQSIIDISHNIEHFNIAHGSFVLKSVYRDFPEGTVHLASVNSSETDRCLALELEGHIFVGPDNGLFSLISEKTPGLVVALPGALTTFPSRDILADAAAQIADGKSLREVGEEIPDARRLIGRQLKATKKQISGHVIRVDHYGNLITNIEKGVFDILNKGAEFTVIVGRERLNRIHRNYEDTEPGDCFIIFNQLGLLEIGINKGNANELLGLTYDSPVHILFPEGG